MSGGDYTIMCIKPVLLPVPCRDGKGCRYGTAPSFHLRSIWESSIQSQTFMLKYKCCCIHPNQGSCPSIHSNQVIGPAHKPLHQLHVVCPSHTVLDVCTIHSKFEIFTYKAWRFTLLACTENGCYSGKVAFSPSDKKILLATQPMLQVQ